MKTDSSPIINPCQVVQDAGASRIKRLTGAAQIALERSMKTLSTWRVSIIKRKRGAERGGLTGEEEEEEMHHRGRVPMKPFQCGKSQALINGCRRY